MLWKQYERLHHAKGDRHGSVPAVKCAWLSDTEHGPQWWQVASLHSLKAFMEMDAMAMFQNGYTGFSPSRDVCRSFGERSLRVAAQPRRSTPTRREKSKMLSHWSSSSRWSCQMVTSRCILPKTEQTSIGISLFKMDAHWTQQRPRVKHVVTCKTRWWTCPRSIRTRGVEGFPFN